MGDDGVAGLYRLGLGWEAQAPPAAAAGGLPSQWESDVRELRRYAARKRAASDAGDVCGVRL